MSASGEPIYILGHSAREHERLDLQGALYREVTDRGLRSGGLAPGHRVLDVGCGSGDVALLCAEIVGPEGHVVAVDRDAGTVAAATRRAVERGVKNVTFELAEVEDLTPREPFDALVGRFFLMHQSDPAATLARAAAAVRPGGSVVMVESSMSLLLEGPCAHPRAPLYERVVRWKCDAVRGAGADLEAGMRLRSTFLAAGLPAPTTRLDARIEGGTDSIYYRYVEESVRSMRPRAREIGVEGLDDAEIETLARDLRAEALALGAVLIAWPAVAAWCTLPGGAEPASF